MRRYRLLRGRTAPRALATEAIVVLADLAVSRDLAALRGRLAGWRAAQVEATAAPPTGRGNRGRRRVCATLWPCAAECMPAARPDRGRRPASHDARGFSGEL